MDTQWLQNLKPGDKVIVSGNHHESLDTVERVTATQIVLKAGRRYRKVDGWHVGGGSAFYSSNLMPVTREAVNRIRLRQLHVKVAQINWRDVPLETLGKVLALVEGSTDENKELL